MSGILDLAGLLAGNPGLIGYSQIPQQAQAAPEQYQQVADAGGATITPLQIGDFATQYAQGKMTAQQVQKAIKGSGWSINLRTPGGFGFDAFDPTGKHHYIEP